MWHRGCRRGTLRLLVLGGCFFVLQRVPLVVNNVMLGAALLGPGKDPKYQRYPGWKHLGSVQVVDGSHPGFHFQHGWESGRYIILRG